MRPFRGRFFRPRGIFEEGRISRFWGDLAGFASSRDLMSALARRAKQARFSRFRYSGAAAVLSRRPERRREAISCA